MGVMINKYAHLLQCLNVVSSRRHFQLGDIVKIHEVPLTTLSEMLHFQPIITERRRGTLEHFFTSVVNLFFIFFVIKSRLLVLNRAVCLAWAVAPSVTMDNVLCCLAAAHCAAMLTTAC